MDNKLEKELDVFIQNESNALDVETEKEILLPDWKKDINNILLLIFLYILQGVYI